MPDETREPDQLSEDELEAQEGEELPDRQAMSLVDANIAIPINAAVAANVLSDEVEAEATEEEEIDEKTEDIDESTQP